jgi:hypothetical protein
MSYCDLEPATFYVVKEIVSRKEHKCCECSAKIASGELYVNARMGFDGSAETFKQHLRCANACRWARDKILDDCLPFGGLQEWWAEEIAYDRSYRKAGEDWKQMRRLYAAVLRGERAAAGARRV